MDRAARRSLAAKLFDDVAARSRDGEGITRESYGPTETTALDLLERFAQSEGLTTARDPAQNLVVDLPDKPSGAAIYVGSHLDSVPQGGNFDGLAGVVAGLLCLVDFRREGARPPRPVRVLGLRGEESAWFGKAYMGSSALLGKLTDEDLDPRHRSEACTLAEAMARTGVEVERVRRGERFFDIDGAPGRALGRASARTVGTARPARRARAERRWTRRCDVRRGRRAEHMIFIRNEHGSHNPHEAVDLDDFALGVELLRLALSEPL